MKKIYYYNTFEDDIISSSNQEYKLNDNYKWIHNNILYKILSYFIYFFVIIISFIYSKLILRVTIKNKKVLKNNRKYYIYSNHTLQYGDIFNPFIINFLKKPYLICSPSNLGIPIIGKILPIAGALPIPDEIHKKLKLIDAMSYYVKKGHPIIIYPESHLWPYYADIRPFNNSAFYFPYNDKVKVFVSTTTFQKSKLFKRPKVVIYIDGPFECNFDLPKKESIKKLKEEVYNTMLKRSKLSTEEFIKYKKR